MSPWKFVCVDSEIGDNSRAHFSHPLIGSLFFFPTVTLLYWNNAIETKSSCQAMDSSIPPAERPMGGPGMAQCALLEVTQQEPILHTSSLLSQRYSGIFTQLLFTNQESVFIWNKLGSPCCSVFMPKWHFSRFHCHEVCSNAKEKKKHEEIAQQNRRNPFTPISFDWRRGAAEARQ